MAVRLERPEVSHSLISAGTYANSQMQVLNQKSQYKLSNDPEVFSGLSPWQSGTFAVSFQVSAFSLLKICCQLNAED
jgi:hypothetical protein